MSLFFVDTTGDKSLISKDAYRKSNDIQSTRELSSTNSNSFTNLFLGNVAADDDDSEDDDDYNGLPPPTFDISKIIEDTLSKTTVHSKIEQELTQAAEKVDAATENARSNKKSKRERITEIDYSDFTDTGKHADEVLVQTNVAAELASSVLQPGFENIKALPKVNIKKQRKIGRLERAKTKGAGWFNLPATEVTEEVKNDLKILQMRSVLDPKHFYKKNDLKVLPKYFQIGTVQHSPLDYYSERHTRKNKKHSIVEEILADEAVQKYTKRKYQEITARKDKYAQRKALKKMRKLKKNK